MKNTSVIYQNYGSSILMFLQGETAEDAMGKWLSLFNWGALAKDAEPNYVTEKTIACWSTIEKFQRYLLNLHEHRLWNLVQRNLTPEEMAQVHADAKAEFEATQTESFRSVNSDGEIYQFGTIVAEKPDEDFASSVLNYAFRDRN